MKVSLLLTLAAIYGGLLGLALLLVPDLILPGVLGTTIPTTVIGNLRGYGGVLIGVAVINWLARNSDASPARDAILFGMFIGFLALTITGILRLLNGPAGAGIVTLIINALFAVGFLVIGK